MTMHASPWLATAMMERWQRWWLRTSRTPATTCPIQTAKLYLPMTDCTLYILRMLGICRLRSTIWYDILYDIRYFGNFLHNFCYTLCIRGAHSDRSVTVNVHQNCIWPGLCRGPCCGILQSSPVSLVGGGWGPPLPSLWTPSASGSGCLQHFAYKLLPPAHPNTNSWLCHYTLCTPVKKFCLPQWSLQY